MNNVKKVINGDYNMFVLSSDNSWYVTGQNTYGQLGLGHNMDLRKFEKTNYIWEKIVCGSTHTFALSNNVWFATGINTRGQLGLGNNLNYFSFTPLSGTYENITCGYNHSFAYGNGKWYATGCNLNGELGLGHNNNINSFSPITGNWDKIVCGDNFSFALSGNKLFSTGFNNKGQLGLGDSTKRNVFTYVGVFDDVVVGSENVFALSGNIWFGVGRNSEGQLGLGNNENKSSFTSTLCSFDKIKSSGYHTIALKNNNIYVTGLNIYNQLNVPTYLLSTNKFYKILGTWSDIYCGRTFTYALGNSANIFEPQIKSPIGQFNFSTVAGRSSTTYDLTAANVVPGITINDLKMGPDINPASSSTGWNATNFASSSQSIQLAINKGEYFIFEIFPNENYELCIDGISGFNVERNSQGPTNIAVCYNTTSAFAASAYNIILHSTVETDYRDISNDSYYLNNNNITLSYGTTGYIMIVPYLADSTTGTFKFTGIGANVTGPFTLLGYVRNLTI